MEVKLQLSVFVLLIHVSAAVWQRVTVTKGQTLTLTCPINNTDKDSVEWKNPEGIIIFFGDIRGLRDKRYSIIKLSDSEFTISLSNVTFKDGGNYLCTQFENYKEKKVEVTVLGLPTMTVEKHDSKYVVKCAAKGNHYAPQIFWKFDDGPEILGYTEVHHKDKKYVSEATLEVHSVQRRVAVKCVVRHPALHSQPFMKFVEIGQDITSPTRPPLDPATATGSHLNITDGTSVSETTEEITSYNHTEGNTPGSINDPKMWAGTGESSTLLVFLVTCLIFSLLVVVIFFAIKLRRAHIIWKRENEDSAPSEDSSKSKSSQEERNNQGQKRRGLVNTTFTQYVSEKPPAITSVINPAATAATPSINKEPTPPPQTQRPTFTSLTCDIKETEL